MIGIDLTAMEKQISTSNSAAFLGKVGFGLRPQPPFPRKNKLANIKRECIFTSNSCSLFLNSTT